MGREENRRFPANRRKFLQGRPDPVGMCPDEEGVEVELLDGADGEGRRLSTEQAADLTDAASAYGTGVVRVE